jgi:hypothetical protein
MTGMIKEDIIYTLSELNILEKGLKGFTININQSFSNTFFKKIEKKGYPRALPTKLKWTPFLINRWLN